MRTLIALLFTMLSTNAAWGQTDEYKEAWAATGYGLVELYSEPDFQPNECEKSEKIFVACLLTLNFLLDSIEENPQKLALDGVNRLVVVANSEKVQNLEYEAYIEEQSQLREDYQLAFQVKSYGSIENLFEEVMEVASRQLPAEDQPYYAGSAYGTFLRAAYDPRMGFMPASEFSPKPQEYFGIGATVIKYETEVEELNGAIALDPMAGSPAAQAGLKKGDLLLAVDGLEVLEEDLSDAILRLKGPVDTEVTLTVKKLCDNTTTDVVVTRGPIVNFPNWVEDSHFVRLDGDSSDPIARICADEPVKPQAGEPQALYVPLTTFKEAMGQDLCDEFVDLQLKDLRNPDSQGIILDIRNNGGGSLPAVACMLNTLISADGPLIGQVPVVNGEVVPGAEPEISYSFDTSGPIQVNGTIYHYNRKIVVLVNEGSASASEIFSGTIQDMKRGWVVGDRTFGKGSVQQYSPHPIARELAEISDEMIMLGRTIAIYTLPSGRSPQQFGVIPDFRYSDLAEPIIDEDGFITIEAKSPGSIEYPNNYWEQNRASQVTDIATCAKNPDSNNETYKGKMGNDERYIRPFVANYQLALAKDVLVCAKDRQPVL